MDTAVDLLIGRPLGMSCGCPITHYGVVMDVDQRTGLINWCVTAPLRVREQSFKDTGYYIAEAYDELIRKSRVEPKIGMWYFFQPRMCMLQWRHGGLVKFMNRTADALRFVWRDSGSAWELPAVVRCTTFYLNLPV